MRREKMLRLSRYPETRFGDFSDQDGAIRFFTRVNALLEPEFTVLDIGCGRGASAEDPVRYRRELRTLRGKCRHVIGIDIDPVAICNPIVDEFRLIDGPTWPVADASIDLAVADYVLEHVLEPETFFSECARVLKRGGVLCLRTPNRYGYVATIARWVPNYLHASVLKMIGKQRDAEDVFPTVYRCNTAGKIRQAMRRHGFDACVYSYEDEPTYLCFSPLAYRLGDICRKFLPSQFRGNLFAFGRKQARVADTYLPYREDNYPMIRKKSADPVAGLPAVERYHHHLAATADWLLRSIRHGRGGSSAHYMPLVGWSKPYPETTGYLIPTLLTLDERLSDRGLRAAAIRLGQWLLGIQLECGAWQGGLYPAAQPKPSVFNTGQILKGMAALHRATGEERWLIAGARGASWLASGVDEQGQWSGTDYRASQMPSYYTHVAWPMLEMWSLTGESAVREAAERVLQCVRNRRTEDGSFSAWSFDGYSAAFTHTIAYTLRGFLESARLLDAWSEYGEPVVEALERLCRQAELSRGRLPGAYGENWQAIDRYCCLTGNAQIAICLLQWEKRQADLRLVNGAAKLVDYVCASQHLRSPWPGIRGGVAGSSPVWHRYMTMRYPNWAAKYHCDALLMLIERIETEMEDISCESCSRPGSIAPPTSLPWRTSFAATDTRSPASLL